MEKKFIFKCPQCGRQFKCPMCGKPCDSIRMAKNALSSGSKYCTGCGKEIATALAEAIAKEDTHL